MVYFSIIMLVYFSIIIYTAMVDDLMNTPVENSAIGLLICKEKNAVMARYALSRINAPIGISEYEVAQRQLPHDLQDKLPTEEEIERRLNRIEGSKDTEWFSSDI